MKCSNSFTYTFNVPFKTTVLFLFSRCLNVDLTELKVNANLGNSDVQSETCKIQPKIPFYLIVAGILNIVLLVMRMIFQVRKA